MTERESVAEGLAEFEHDRAVEDARQDLIEWCVAVLDPCCQDCGWLDYARAERRAAMRRWRILTGG